MNTDYFTEEGCELNYEDLISSIIWKIKDLKSSKYTNDEILNFNENEIWKKYCKIILSNNINK